MAKIMFPVFLKEEGKTPPTEGTYFIVAKNGIFLRKSNGWVDATVPVNSIDVLETQAVSATVLLPRLPSIITAKTLAFLRKVKETNYTEALVLLHHSKEKGWEMSVPKQKVGIVSVDYDRSERLPGYNCMGTIHSHPGFGAFHSGTDKNDESDWDGVHITIGGDMNDSGFQLDAEIVVNNRRFTLPKEWLEGVVELEDSKQGVVISYGVGIFGTAAVGKKLCSVSCPELNGWQVPDEWLAKVERRFIVSTVSLGGFGNQFVDLFKDDKAGPQLEIPTTDAAPTVISKETTVSIAGRPATRPRRKRSVAAAPAKEVKPSDKVGA